MDFAELIAPVSVEHFFGTHWERAPLHLTGRDDEYFAGLLTIRDFDRLLADFGRPHAQGVRLARHEDRSNGSLPGEVPVHVDALYEAYNRGHTINVNDVAERHAAIRALTDRLFALFTCKITANLFLTPAGSRAFPLHFDTHEVLVLQLSGRKHWRVYAPGELLPIKEHTVERELPADPGRPLLLERELLPGDVLYVPRGFGHEAFTDGHASLHLTVGLHALTYRDLMVALVERQARSQPAMRRALPPGALAMRVPGDEAAQQLRAIVQELAANIDADGLVDDAAAAMLAARPCLPGARFAAPPLDTIGVRTALQKRAGALCRVVLAAGTAVLHFQGNALRGPGKLGPAFEYIAARAEPFTATDLPGDLDERERRLLARRLVREGLLQHADGA
jgi:ribosomal protein L16 Arg81 hydroxylase